MPDRKESAQYRIRGMDCAEEVAALKRALSGAVEADRLRFDLLEGVMDVPASVPGEVVVERVAQAGMRAVPLSNVTALPARTHPGAQCEPS